VQFMDLVYGPVEYDCTDNNYEGDPIIIKSDGFPTYHFANVVDDHFMDISHVLRGVEWQVSTPKHLQLYKWVEITNNLWWLPNNLQHEILNLEKYTNLNILCTSSRRAFKWTPPEFAHLPLVCNKDGTKLSKRQGDISIRHYESQFYYPRALTNFVTKSGGGFTDHGVDTIYSVNDLAAMVSPAFLLSE